MPKANLNRVAIPKQEPQVRIKNFNEVALGYTYEQAIEEARRCVQAPKAPCVTGCPVNVDIPSFIKALQEEDLPRAAKIIWSTNSLPAICGRVCPQEEQCEKKCVLAKLGAPVAIGRLERFVADWARENPEESGVFKVDLPKSTGKKVAIVGSGPAGLTCAADLAKKGHQVTIFEALHVAGGVLMYGIPEFRLPKRIVEAELNFVRSLGVEMNLDMVMGKIATVDDLLRDGHHAVFLGIGAGAPQFLNVPGENLSGVYSANEFLTRINLMKAYLFPEYDTPIRVGKKVAIVGAGNVAMDCVRWSMRLGAEVNIIYRRTEAEMTARLEELENAKEEGAIFRLLTNPKRFLGNQQGWVESIECLKMQLGEPDASGRRRPIAIPGSEFTMEFDTVVSALGTVPNKLLPSTTPGLEISNHGTIIADHNTGKTSKDMVWAGGDITTGAATVIQAMGAGKRAAADIDAYLQG
jgi:glutamate synthase (NADPH/NADH) small chain